MKATKQNVARQACETFIYAINAKLRAIAPGREEDQLRRPVDQLLETIGKANDLDVVAKDESPLRDQPGRPDFAVTVDRLLCGYLELKAPGTGTDPRRYKGHRYLIAPPVERRRPRPFEYAANKRLRVTFSVVLTRISVIDLPLLPTAAGGLHCAWHRTPAERASPTAASLCRKLRHQARCI